MVTNSLLNSFLFKQSIWHLHLLPSVDNLSVWRGWINLHYMFTVVFASTCRDCRCWVLTLSSWRIGFFFFKVRNSLASWPVYVMFCQIKGSNINFTWANTSTIKFRELITLTFLTNNVTCMAKSINYISAIVYICKTLGNLSLVFMTPRGKIWFEVPERD